MNLSNLSTQPASGESLEKQAEAVLFCKLAAQNGFDLNKMTDEEVETLYNYTFDKQASEGEEAEKDEEKEDEEKKEAAAREHQQKLAAARDVQHADELGRRMAHSYVDELNKIGSALQDKTATPALPAAGLKGAGGRAATSIGQAARKIRLAAERGGGKAVDFAKKNKGAIGAGAGGAAAGGAAGYVAGKKKESSALDQLALEEAVKIAEASGFDGDEAAERVVAVHTLGLNESTKVASDLNGQVELRALEFLEAAGYPVEWAQ